MVIKEDVIITKGVNKKMDWLKLLNLFGILQKMVNSISGELREAIVEGLKKAREAAKKTDNKADDILMDLLCFIFAVD